MLLIIIIIVVRHYLLLSPYYLSHVRWIMRLIVVFIDNVLLYIVYRVIQRALEGAGANNTNILNLFNVTGDPRDYAWGSTGLDNIISQLMEQQSG